MSPHARARLPRAPRPRARGYTLVELLIVVAMLGLATALVIPSMSSAGNMRIQGAVRSIVADITVTQADAIAFQSRRAVVFNFEDDTARYVVAEITAGEVDTDTGIIYDRSFAGERFGNATITDNNLTDNTMFFDEMGAPIDGPTSDNPAPAQYVEITGSNQRFRVNIEAYTGRVTVQRMQ
ncbi:MAG TPA: prepilin-type N-terminal cleavage/methylation domain-containing protein [Phycisphaerales bacterium]|nr:prepilin-type N-terminal cleavage/methylation domain-containing protein [Phycisphaerales bacterium]